jgi:hypothetical protein
MQALSGDDDHVIDLLLARGGVYARVCLRYLALRFFFWIFVCFFCSFLGMMMINSSIFYAYYGE